MNTDSSCNEPLIFDHIKGEVRRGRIVSWPADDLDVGRDSGAWTIVT